MVIFSMLMGGNEGVQSWSMWSGKTLVIDGRYWYSLTTKDSKEKMCLRKP
jgi:hypothetical protein